MYSRYNCTVCSSVSNELFRIWVRHTMYIIRLRNVTVLLDMSFYCSGALSAQAGTVCLTDGMPALILTPSRVPMIRHSMITGQIADGSNVQSQQLFRLMHEPLQATWAVTANLVVERDCVLTTELSGPIRTRSCFSLFLSTEEHRLRQAKALLQMRRTCNLPISSRQPEPVAAGDVAARHHQKAVNMWPQWCRTMVHSAPCKVDMQYNGLDAHAATTLADRLATGQLSGIVGATSGKT
jgi:hypothetical protein